MQWIKNPHSRPVYLKNCTFAFIKQNYRVEESSNHPNL